LVTGGAHRVGGAISSALADAGMDVVVHYLSSEAAARATTTEIEARGRRALAVAADVADPDAVHAMVANVADELGPVDLLVNSASYFERDEFPTADLSVWRTTMDVVLDGAFHCANAVAPGMLARGSGAIVNVVDLSAWQPWPGRAAHSVAKAGLLALTRQLAVELAPSVRANAVALGPTIPPERFGPEQVERLRSRTLTGRWGGGDEVGRAVRYLAEADAVTGTCLTVDGGEQYGHVRDRFLDD
jgi:NAD(P)-dependent dehydrogenase (short-subunit alcohol dehydrogenase family)